MCFGGAQRVYWKRFSNEKEGAFDAVRAKTTQDVVNGGCVFLFLCERRRRILIDLAGLLPKGGPIAGPRESRPLRQSLSEGGLACAPRGRNRCFGGTIDDKLVAEQADLPLAVASFGEKTRRSVGSTVNKASKSGGRGPD